MSQDIEARWSALESWLARPWVVVASILVSLCVGIGLAATHLGEAIWQDEVATIVFHASRGVVDPFLHYVSPNSHVAFTSLLAAWLKLFPGGMDLLRLRALPLLLFAAAIPVTFAAARRLGGIACAHAATLLFASSAVSENFATQLRGYGPSWVFMAAALYCALAARTRRGWLLGYFASSMGAVAMLPTNVYLLGVIGASAAAMVLSDPAAEARRERILALLLVPALALLVAYGAIWRELMSYASVDFSDWTRTGLLREWLRGANSNLWPVIPFAGAGMALAFASAAARRRLAPPVVGGLGLTLGLVLLLAVMPNPPFPRTLVPYLPAWIAAMCALGVSVVRQGPSRRGLVAALAGALLLTVGLAVGPQSKACRGAQSDGTKYQYDLCHQYFRDEYDPVAVLDAWAAQPLRRPIVSDYEGYYALWILGSHAHLYEYRNIRERLRARPLVVAHDSADARTMIVRMGLDPRAYHLLADTGYFKVFEPERLP